MSKGARLRAQRATARNPLHHAYGMKRPGERIEVRACPGLTVNDPGAIAAMQKQTHDALIIELADRRRSGIRWKLVHGADECTRVMDEVWDVPEAPANVAAELAEYRAFIAEHPENVVMVIALAEWAVPR